MHASEVEVLQAEAETLANAAHDFGYFQVVVIAVWAWISYHFRQEKAEQSTISTLPLHMQRYPHAVTLMLDSPPRLEPLRHIDSQSRSFLRGGCFHFDCHCSSQLRTVVGEEKARQLFSPQGDFLNGFIRHSGKVRRVSEDFLTRDQVRRRAGECSILLAQV